MNDPQIKIEISKSGLEAYATVYPSWEDETGTIGHLTSSDILRALTKTGVNYGIDYEAIEAMVKSDEWGERILVASGVEPIFGKKGSISYTFDLEKLPHPKEIENGRVDYRDIGLIHCVQKDEVLARRTLAAKGTLGLTVRGETIPTRSGDEVLIHPGLNTYFVDAERTELRASTAGSVSLQNGIVQVENPLIQKGDVCFNSGNIEFPADVIIMGDVHSGFRVCAGGSVEIFGFIEDALVEAGRDILVKGGFIGSGQGKIISGGNVFVKFVEYQTINAVGSVFIGESCIQGEITAGEAITLTTGNGTVVGGHLKAGKEITVLNCGNLQNTCTIIELASNQEKLTEKLNLIEGDTKAHKKTIADLRNQVFKLQQHKTNNAIEDYRSRNKIRKFQDFIYLLDSELEILIKELNKIQGEIDTGGCIQINKKVFPGTNLIINGTSQPVLYEHERSRFKLVNGEIINLNNRRLKVGAK